MQLCLFQLWTKTSGAMELCYSLQVEESAFHVALSSTPFPTGITQCKLSLCLCHYLALVAQFQHTAMYHLIIYILLASYLVPQLPSQMYWDNWIRDSLKLQLLCRGQHLLPMNMIRAPSATSPANGVFPWRLTSHRLKAATEFLK